MRTDKPIGKMVIYSHECSQFIASVIEQIMVQHNDLQNVEAIGELVKYLIRSWNNELEAQYDLIPREEVS